MSITNFKVEKFEDESKNLLRGFLVETSYSFALRKKFMDFSKNSILHIPKIKDKVLL